MTPGNQIVEIRPGYIKFHTWLVIETTPNDSSCIAWVSSIPHANTPAQAWANFCEWWGSKDPQRTMRHYKQQGYRARRFTVTIDQQATVSKAKP